MRTEFANSQASRAHVFEGPGGLWTVRDDEDRRGGLFNDHKAAMKFVRREFGLNAQVVFSRGR